MQERLRQVKAEELVRALVRLGFDIRRQTGSHIILRHCDTKGIVVVPRHAREIKRGLLFSILKQAGVTRKGFLDALRK